MDLTDAVRERRSFRAFKADPVPLEVLKKIMEQALRAPSWANTQPWEFVVATGKPLEAIRETFLQRGEQEPQSEVARPSEFPEPYLSRIQAPGPGDFTPTKADLDRRRVQGIRNYGAPAMIYVLVDQTIFYQSKGINVWCMFDCGSIVQNIMLLATNYGLGTVAQAQSVIYPDIIRSGLDIPIEKLITIGIAIGYPDRDDPANQTRTGREPLDRMVTWRGFE
jgi:nitroreductase